MSERLKTGLIIAGIYLLFILYLLFVSYRVEALDHSYQENSITVNSLSNR